MLLADETFSKREMMDEVARRAVWEEIDTGKQVILKHYFRDDATHQMDLIFGEPNAKLDKHADWFDFQQRYVKVGA